MEKELLKELFSEAELEALKNVEEVEPRYWDYDDVIVDPDFDN